MSRETNINVNVNSGKSIATISKLKEAFEGLKVAKDSVASDGKIKLAIDFKGADGVNLDAMSKAIARLGTGMKNVAQNSKVVADAGGAFNVTSNNITNNSYKASKAVDSLGNSIENVGKQTVGGIMALDLLKRSSMEFINTFSKLTGTTFDVGIASQMNISEIEALNGAFLKLSTTVPTSANEMAQAVDALIRTGRGFEESKKIIEQVAILSTASGDNIKDTAQVVTKVMVSLNISADRVNDTLNTMHSTAIQTASDMGYLAEAFKNVAGSASVMAKQSGLTGRELDDYKQNLLDFSMSAIGSMANLGLSASSAGTKIKTLFTKLSATEKSAKALFDAEMKIKNIKFDTTTQSLGNKGDLFDFNALSNLAKKDLPQAVQLMSELYNKGQLSTQTMQKMFTARHFMEISDLLLVINGDMDTFTANIAKGVNYADDFYKKMFDINKQWVQLGNNMSASFGGSGNYFIQSATGLLMALNEGAKNMNSDFMQLISTLGGVATAFFGVNTAVNAFVTYGAPLVALVKNITPAGRAISLATAGITLMSKAYYDTNKQVADLNINMGTTLMLTNKVGNQLSTNEVLQKRITDLMKDQELSKGIAPQIEEATTVMNLLLNKSKDVKDILDSISKYNESREVAVPTLDLDKMEKDRDRYKKQVEETRQLIVGGADSYVQAILESKYKMIQARDSGEKVIDERTYSNMMSTYDTDISKAKSIYDKYVQLITSGKPIEEAMKELTESSKQFGASSGYVQKFLSSLDNNILSQHIRELKTFSKDLEDTGKEILEAYKTLSNTASLRGTALNTIIANTNKDYLDILERTGKYKGKKGAEGYFQLISETSVSKFKNNIEQATSVISTLKKEEDELLKKSKDKAGLDSNEEDRLKVVQGSLVLANKEKQDAINLASKGLSITKEEIDMLSKGITLEGNKGKGYRTLNDIVALTLEKKQALEAGDTAQAELLDKQIASKREVAKIDESELQAKKRKTDYEIKYTNYVKEDLSVQLEIAKLMQTQGAQQMLIYEYKKKELEANREIAKSDVSSARNKLLRQGIDTSGLSSSVQVQEILSAMDKQYGNVIQDKAIKDRIEAYKDLGKSLAKEEGLTRKIDILPWKEFNSTLESIPSTVEKVYKSLGDLGEFRGDFGFKTKMQSYLDRDLKNQVAQFNDSFRQRNEEGVVIEALGLDSLPEALEKAKNDLLLFEDKAREAMSKRSKGAELSPEEDAIVMALVKQQKETEDLIRLNDKLVNKKQLQLEIDLKILDTYVKMGDTLSKFGSAIDSQGLQDFGDMISSFGDMQTTMKKNPNLKFGDMFKDIGSEAWADSFAKNLENAMAGIDFGANIGQQIANTFGGGQSAKSGGALGGMIAGAGGASALSNMMTSAGLAMSTGGASLAISAGMSLIGGLFDSGGNEQAKADKKTAEAKKAYDKNTDALNELSRNMANLNAGIDTLNGSLISSFSNLPTFGNLNDVTSTLEEMYTLMYTTRNFDSVAYQVTKTKKGKSGFLGMGGSQGSTWTETYEKDIQEMLDIYGYKGTIYDMTTDEMRDFAEWLDEYDMGDTDNFSQMADALEEYAEALDKFDKNIDKFFYDATMESFVGISSMQQEALRQQIEDFYKNLGIVIDDEISAEIDKLAEQMSVMVTIMQDVRNDFIDIWMDTGESAGSAFVKSMKPYMEALMNNMAQVFYDVYLSDVTKGLSDEFKAMSEELVELKKQGAELDWDDVTDALSDNFEKVLEYISSAKEQTESFNDVILELQEKALEAGFTISELIDMGIATGTQKTVVDSFEQALLSDEEAFITIGKMVGDMVGEAMAKSMIDNLMSEQVLAFSNQLDEVLNGNMSFDSLAGLAGDALSIGMMMESERKRLEAIMDMFNMGDVTYENQESKISYEQGVSQSLVQNFFLSSSIEAGNVIESDSVERLADELLDQIIEKLKVDKGIDITKNY